MLSFFKKSPPKEVNEFHSIERKFEKLFWEELPPLHDVRIFITPEEAFTLGLDSGSQWVKLDTADRTRSVFEGIQVGNLIHEQLVFKPIKQLELFIANSEILVRKLVY